jgi:hypothetical protein
MFMERRNSQSIRVRNFHAKKDEKCVSKAHAKREERRECECEWKCEKGKGKRTFSRGK